jgi:hypothetical protein
MKCLERRHERRDDTFTNKRAVIENRQDSFEILAPRNGLGPRLFLAPKLVTSVLALGKTRMNQTFNQGRRYVRFDMRRVASLKTSPSHFLNTTSTARRATWMPPSRVYAGCSRPGVLQGPSLGPKEMYFRVLSPQFSADGRLNIIGTGHCLISTCTSASNLL